MRWTTPFKGLLAGASHQDEFITGTGTADLSVTQGGAAHVTDYWEKTKKNQTDQFYAEYTVGILTLDSEYRRSWRDVEIFDGALEDNYPLSSHYHQQSIASLHSQGLASLPRDGNLVFRRKRCLGHHFTLSHKVKHDLVVGYLESCRFNSVTFEAKSMNYEGRS